MVAVHYEEREKDMYSAVLSLFDSKAPTVQHNVYCVGNMSHGPPWLQQL